MSLLDQCHLTDKYVADEQHERLKLKCNSTVQNFLENCKNTLFENGYYKKRDRGNNEITFSYLLTLFLQF